MDNERVCFVIMPISDIPSYEEGHFKRVYDYLIKPAIIRAGFSPIRADEVKRTNFIIVDILKQIVNSDMCICDLSSRNPNVLYELGIRQAFRLPVTIIRDTKTDRIFDIQGLRDIEYNENLRIDSVNSSIEGISETILNTYNNRGNDINSIVDLLGVLPPVFFHNLNGKEDDLSSLKQYDLQVCIENFLIFKERDGLSKATIKTYRNQLQYLVELMNKNVNEYTEDDIKSFLVLRGEKESVTSKSTLETIRRILKVFFDWLVDENLSRKNPVNRVKPYKANDIYMEALNEKELDEVRMACINIREKALIELMCSTGCRLNEIVNLEISKIDWTSKAIIVDKNTRSSRIVFLTPLAADLLKEYLNSRNDDCKEVFVSLRKPYTRIQSRAIQREIKNIVKRTSIVKEVSPKTFRNTFTRIMLEKGCPLNVLQDLLGHKYYSTTAATSFRLNIDSKKEIYQKYYSE